MFRPKDLSEAAQTQKTAGEELVELFVVLPLQSQYDAKHQSSHTHRM